jgi:putative holliday junction resolvase
VPRVLGVDFGERRVGIAISDPTATIAQPLTVLTRRPGKRPPVQAVSDLAAEHDVSHIVIGLPLALSGNDTDWTREVRDFGEKLRQRSGLGVSFADERLTSVMAERAVRSLGLRKQEREQKQRVDSAAAILILQAYLDSLKQQTQDGQDSADER